jgi:hypothetical protein
VRIRRAWPALGYAALFLVLGFPWVHAAAGAVPAGNPFAFADDARLLIWVLGWVAYALRTRPSSLLDAGIHHPAPAQLTGSEHLASTQLLAVPAVWLTGNPILVANLVVFLSYPLAAFAMYRLALTLGCSAAAAWVGGLVFALGPLRVPANIQVLHFLNLYLPLAALALHRLRDGPTPGRALVLFGVLTAGALSGYYLTVMLVLVATAWTGIEALRRAPGRDRFLALAAVAGAGAAAILLVVSRPYFDRPELAVGVPVGDLRAPGTLGWKSTRTLLRLLFGIVPGALALLGLGALVTRRATPARSVAAAGLALVIVGLLGVFPPGPLVDAIQSSPLRFLRAQTRFAVVAGFGTALLAVAALETVRARLGPRAGVAAAIAAAVALFGAAWPSFPGGRDWIAAFGVDRGVYDAVARVAAHEGPGPLLELPLADAQWRQRGGELPLGQLESEAMIGSLRHRLPLVTGHTGYQPLHRALLERAIADLPQPSALDELVDLTHVRWLLLRPADYWKVPRVRERLLALPGVSSRFGRDGWTLALVDVPVRRPEWYAAIAEGYRPGRTVLGTPLAPLAEADAVGQVTTPPTMFVPLQAGAVWSLVVEARNRGAAPWPATVPGRLPPTYTVRFVARWRRADLALPAQMIAVRRDVPPGDSVVQTLALDVPAEPGDYVLEIGLEQDAGARFTAPGNAPLRLQLTVTPPIRPAPVPRPGGAT